MPQLRIHPADALSSHLAYDLHRPDRPADGEICGIFCHGFASSRHSEKARYFADRMARNGLACCRFDFQGHGDSGGSITDMTPGRNIADLGLLTQHLRSEGFRRFVLFGSSMGAGIAAWHAALFPEDVLAAVFIAPGFDLEAGVRRRLGDALFRRWEEERRVTLHHELGSYDLDWGMIEDLRSRNPGILATLYQTPTLIFQGKNDTDVPWRSVADFAAACPRETIQLHLMTDGDHRLLGRIPFLWRMTRVFLEDRGVLREMNP